MDAVANATTDQLLDFANTVCDTPAKALRRERTMYRTHAKDLDACECCARPVVPGTLLGPTCAKKFIKWLAR